MQQRQQQELLRQKGLEDARRRAEEARQREALVRQQREQQMLKAQQDMVRRREESTAMVAARNSIQRIRTTAPENFDQVRLEVEAALAEQIPKSGAQAALVKQEADRTIEQARQRVELVKAHRAKEEARKA